MTLLAVIAALVLERILGHLEDLRDPAWFVRYVTWLRGRLGDAADGALGVVLALAVPVAALALLQLALGSVLWGVPGLLLAVAVLLWSLGPRDLDAEAERFLDAWERGDDLEARRFLERLGAAAPEEERALWPALAARAVTGEANGRIFGVLFWFTLLGPVGALLYRLARTLAEAARGWGGGFHEAAETLVEILDWIPLRLTMVGYALAGDFEETFHAWRTRQAEGVPADSALLAEAGAASLELDPDEGPGAVRAALGLVWRTVLIWVTLVAVLTLAGVAA